MAVAKTDSGAGAFGEAGAPAAPRAAVLPFIEDDYEKALTDARAKGRPIFVDVWATWCHTCLSLKEFVFTDPSMSALKDEFTWLSVDSEKPENAALVKRLGLEVLPTLWMIDPKTEAAMWSWKGGLTAAELVAALDDARSRPRGTAKDAREALTQFRSALAIPNGAKGALTALERERAVDAFVSLLSDAKAFDECATVAAREGPRLPMGTYRVDVAATAISCLADAKPGSAGQKLLPEVIAELTVLTRSRSKAVLVDDRSSAYEALVSALKNAGDKLGATLAARDWAGLLEAAATAARSPRERAVFDAHRLNAYLELGEPARALPMLDATEKDFPDDYNPSARKARAYFELRRYDDALASVDRALARAYGGRRLRIYLLKADILEKAGQPGKARTALEAALEDTKGARLRVGYERLRQSVVDRLGSGRQTKPR